MESRSFGRSFERRKERRPLSETARAALAGLFMLTTQACDICFNAEHSEMEREAAEAEARAKAERNAETPAARDRRIFKEKLVELEKDGYSIEISGVIFIADLAGPTSGQMLDDINSIQNGLSLRGDATSCVKIIEETTDPLANLKQQLERAKTGLKEIDVPIYQLTLKPNETGITLTVDNWLTDRTVITRELESFDRTNNDYATWEKGHDAKLNEVKYALRQDKETLAATYGKFLTEHGVSLNAMDIVQIHAGTGMEEMAKLFTTGQLSSVKFNGFKHDQRKVSSPFIAWDFYASDQSELALTGSPELPGTLTSVVLRRLDLDTVPSWWQGQSTSEIFQDNYGNTVMVETVEKQKNYTHKGEPAELYEQTILIMVPTKFIDSSGSESEAIGWNVDLTKLDLPELTNFAFSHPERPVATRTSELGFTFNLYYEGEDRLTHNVYDGYFDTAMLGTLEMQYAFYGYDPDQQLVSNILVVPTNGEKNGYFAARNSATIALTDEHMNLMEASHTEVMSTARHETSHALFNHLQLGSYELLTELHKRLSPAFFTAIAEANWEIDGFGGHPQDNTTELFASFMNSLMVNDLETTMRAKLTPVTAAEYADVAKIMRTMLSKPLITQNSPHETIQILEKLTEAEGLARQIAASE